MRFLSVVAVLISCALSRAAGDGFENYLPGQEIGSQAQWLGNATVSDEESVEGNQSLKIGPGQTASRKSEIQDGVVFWNFYILPVFGQGEAALDVAGAQIGFRRNGSKGEVLAYSEDSPIVVPSEVSPVAENGEMENWLHFTIRVDRAKGVWDLYLDSRPVLPSVKLGDGCGLKVNGRPSACTYLDAVEERKTNPIFEDKDVDGMPDAEEIAHGLNPFVDDRDADLDGNGISNVRDYFLKYRPPARGNTLTKNGRVLFVDNLMGDDAWSGSYSYAQGNDGPKATLKAAMEQAPSGATIYLMKGTGVYSEGSRGSEGKTLTIRAIEPVKIQ